MVVWLRKEPIVIAASALLIAALSTPPRRIQRTIDCRFSRRTYDAAKMLAAFSATLRTQIPLLQDRHAVIALLPGTITALLRATTSRGRSVT